MDSNYILGVDIGGTWMRASVADEHGIICKLKQLTKKVGDDHTLARQADALLLNVMETARVPVLTRYPLGVNTCSPFDTIDGHRVHVTPNICEGLSGKGKNNDWKTIPFEKDMRQTHPAFEMENDCVGGEMAEHTFGALRGCENDGYVTISSGIGGGFRVNGRILQGRSNAGHIGHQIVNMHSDRRCGCGAYGHLEAEASGPAITDKYLHSIVEHLSLEHRVARQKELAKTIETKTVFERFHTDPLAQLVVREAATYIAMGLANICALYDVEKIALGGSVWKDRVILRPLIDPKFREYSFPILAKDVRIVDAALDDYLGDIAAFCLVMPESWKKTWQTTEPWKSAPKTIEVP